MEEKIIIYALPVFFALIALEFGWGILKKRNTYRLNDALSSLSQGVISQLIALITQLFQIGLYALVFQHVALWHKPDFWHAWYGWVLGIVFFDFCDYWLHRFGHESAVMWAAHSVHHQSEDFNFSTALRQESTVVLIGWLFYLPMALAGIGPEQFAIAGLIVLIYQFWIHTEHIGKLGILDRLVSTPSNHRVHHAVNKQYLDKNYGGMLIIWDRMFGTFAAEEEPCIYGTRPALNSWNPVWAIVGGYHKLWKLAGRTPDWRDKIRVWFKGPGWRPPNLRPLVGKKAASAASATQTAMPQKHERYDPPVPKNAAVLAILQFIFLLAIAALYMWFGDDFPYSLSLLSSCLLITGFWGLGRFLENRWSALRLTLLDLGLIVGGILVVWGLGRH